MYPNLRQYLETRLLAEKYADTIIKKEKLKMNEDVLKVLGAILLIAIIILAPFISIAAVNYLFGTTIGYTFWNWLAVEWLHFVVAHRSTKG